MGFNSLNAYASVNNLHLQGYYLENDKINQRDNLYPIPVQNIIVRYTVRPRYNGPQYNGFEDLTDIF